MNPRLDLVLLKFHERFGAAGLAVAVALIAYVACAKLHRAFACVALTLILTQIWWIPAATIAFYVRWWLIGILGVRGLLHILGRRGVAGDPAPKAPLLLAALALVSCVWAENRSFSLQVAASFALGMVVVFLILWRLLDEIESLDGIFRPVLAFAFVTFGAGFGLGWWGWAGGDRVLLTATGWDGRFKGVFLNPNMSGLLGAIALPVILAAPRSALGNLAWMRWPTLLLIGTAVVLSGSRSALVGSVLALSLLGLRRFGIGALLVYGMLLVLAFLVASHIPVSQFEEGVLGNIVRTRTVRTLSGRTELWQRGWDAAQGHLALGNGWASSRALDEINMERSLAQGGIRGGTNLHNAHLQLLVDLGFVGVTLFWWFCLRVIGSGLRIVRSARDPRTTVPLLFFASSMALLADSFAHGGVFSVGSPSSLVFWCFAAVTLKEGARLRRAAREPAAEVPPASEAERPEPALAPA